MPDLRQVVRATMSAMVDAFGCYDSVATLLNARWGGGSSKGTISKKCSGHLDFTIADAIALEDALGRYPVTQIMARRREGRPSLRDGNLISDGSSIAKESGEAIAAILAAETSDSANDRVQAIKQIDDAIFSLRQARERIEAEGRGRE